MKPLSLRLAVEEVPGARQDAPPSTRLRARLLERGWLLLLLVPGLWALAVRPAAPLDELRYLAVAWEMWQGHDFLVPHLNGVPYSHKPPLLFWLVQAGWGIFGVHEWWPRLISPLAAVIATILTARLGRSLWPDGGAAARTVPWLLAGALGWIVFSQMLLFDMLLTVAVLLAALGTWKAGREGSVPAFGLLTLGLALGLLAKGPVVLIHGLMPALLAPVWLRAPGLQPGVPGQTAAGLAGTGRGFARWYGRVLLATVAALAIAACWALPAARHGGPEYAAAILWGQTTGRMADSFAHARPFWAYAIFLPALLLPWVLWPRAWKLPARDWGRSPGTRFAAGWAAGVVLVLSLISAKQPHYALPAVPPILLLMARAMTVGGAALPIRGALASVVLALLAGALFLREAGPGLDLGAPARQVHDLQAAGADLAVVGRYQGQLHFPGRLPVPLPEIRPAEAAAWAAAHPRGYLVTFGDSRPAGVRGRPLQYPYRSHHIWIWPVSNGEVPGGPQS